MMAEKSQLDATGFELRNSCSLLPCAAGSATSGNELTIFLFHYIYIFFFSFIHLFFKGNTRIWEDTQAMYPKIVGSGPSQAKCLK